MKRNFRFLLVIATLVGCAAIAEAQQPTKVPRIGFVGGSSASANSDRIEAFRQRLRELGWVEGENIAFEYRYAEGKFDRLSDLASELVRLKVDVIVTASTQAARAAQQATRTIPIVMVAVSDPVRSGLVASLARPGGNITGLSQMNPELSGKRLELLKEVVPRVSRVAILWNPDDPGAALSLRETEVVAQALGVEPQPMEVRGSNDFEKAFSAMTRKLAGALIVLPDPLTTSHLRRIADLALKNSLPAMGRNEFAEAGGLMAYGAGLTDQFRRAAYYVDKILKRTKPAELPVEQPTKFELLINLKAAKQIGLTIPPNVLARADKVIR